jgi:glycosyltransferase involved in cell wall biosynthesis
MTILHITTLLQGGAGRIIADLALAQRAAGHQVCVVADDGGAEGYGTYPEYVEDLRQGGVEYHTVRSTFTRDVGLNAAAATRLRSIVSAARADVIHAHAAIPALIGRLFAGTCARPVPVLSTMHGWGVRKTPEQAATDVAVLNQTDAVVVPSRAAAAQLTSLGVDAGRLRLIPYGLGPAPDAPLPQEDVIRIAEVRRRVRWLTCCIGTVGERKNQRLIVDALASAPHLAAGCVFIGDGDLAGLSDYIQSRGVWSRAIVLGPRPAASRYLALGDALVLTSRNEGLPLAVLEALRDGTAVVASAIPEIREIFQDGASAWLSTPGDAGALVESLTALAAAAPSLLASQKARNAEIFAERYARGRMVDGYGALYDALGRGEGRTRQVRAAGCRA